MSLETLMREVDEGPVSGTHTTDMGETHRHKQRGTSTEATIL